MQQMWEAMSMLGVLSRWDVQNMSLKPLSGGRGRLDEFEKTEKSWLAGLFEARAGPYLSRLPLRKERGET